MKKICSKIKWHYLYEIFFTIACVILFVKFPIALLILPVFAIYFAFCLFRNRQNKKSLCANGIIFGSRGSGKSLLFQFLANRLPRHSCNVPFNKKTEILNVKEYINSVAPNVVENVIDGQFIVVDKKEKYEGLPILIDDVSLYFPNFEDTKLKKLYPQMPLTLAVNRHLYNSFCVINVQDLDRPYKILRELQTDFAIRVEKTKVSWLPFMRFFIKTTFLYYERIKSAAEGVLPPPKVGILRNRTKKVEIALHNAQFGLIYRSSIVQRLNRLTYDTRYYHKKFFGFSAPKRQKARRRPAKS